MKELLCPICYAKKDIVVMDYDKSKNFYKCPYCKTEVWPDDDAADYALEQEILARHIEQVNYQVRMSVGGRYTEVLSLVPEIAKGGGGNNTGRRRRPPPKKKLPIYYPT